MVGRCCLRPSAEAHIQHDLKCRTSSYHLVLPPALVHDYHPSAQLYLPQLSLPGCPRGQQSLKNGSEKDQENAGRGISSSTSRVPAAGEERCRGGGEESHHHRRHWHHAAGCRRIHFHDYFNAPGRGLRVGLNAIPAKAT